MDCKSVAAKTALAATAPMPLDKVLQLRPWRFLCGPSSYALHLKYHKLNLLGSDGVDKEA